MTMDEEMYEEDSSSPIKTPVKKKKKSKKRKHDESEDDQQNDRSYVKNETSYKDEQNNENQNDEDQNDEDQNDEDQNDEDQNDENQNDEVLNVKNELNEPEEEYEYWDNNGELEDETQIHDETTSDRLIQKSYISQPFSCVEHLRKAIKFPLLPIAINQEFKIIKQTLIHKWKFKFINELNGFLYFFENLELIEQENGYQAIIDDLPFIYYNIIADFYVFRPRTGEYLKAKISCFEDSNKVINCSTDIEMTITIELPEEISDKLNKYLKLHQDIIFLIKSVDYFKMIIEGTINKRCIKLMEEHIEISQTATESDELNESNLDDFFAN